MRNRPSKRLLRPFTIGLAAGAGLALALALILISWPGSPSPQVTATPSPRFLLQDKVKGSPDAAVTIVEYSDFQCIYCARFATEVAPALERDYIAPGQVRLEFKHFAFLGEESVLAAEASECAREQGQFWPYHDLLFASQSGENRGAFSKAGLKSLASRLGLDQGAFDRCLDTRRYSSLVRQETEGGRQLGVDATPSFFIGERAIRGLPSLQSLRQLLDSLLKEGVK